MSEKRLGDFYFEKKSFGNLDAVFKTFYKEDFKNFGDRKRSDQVNRTLLELIQKEKEPCFLLPHVLNFVERVDKEDILHHYILTSFELWLNQYSGLTAEENYRVRAKIAGKYIPREEYQSLFPIGMGKVYSGTHFVTAHKSPDLDTTIASFWGWLDAFAARVGDSLHIWNLPGGPPPSQIEIDLIFRDIFSDAVFTHLPKTRTVLSLTGNDLMTQENMIVKSVEDKKSSIHHERTQKAIVIVDEQGYYLGDWRSIDVEGVRAVLMLLNHCLRWFENDLHINLIELFSKKDLKKNEIPEFLQKMFGMTIGSTAPAQEFNEEEKKRLDELLKKVFSLDQGIEANFQDFGMALSERKVVNFERVMGVMDSIEKQGLFDDKGMIIEDRSRIFSVLAKIIKGLHNGIQTIRQYTEDLDTALQVKQKVFGFSPKFVTVRADVEEIRSKMDSYHYLTVAYPDQDRFFPMGVIPASLVRKKILGSVSLRDFSNRSEMTIPSYLEVISVIDHHKLELETYQPPLMIISDAQSSNAIVAEKALEINHRYSLSGLKAEAIKKQVQEKGRSVGIRFKLMHYEKILESKGDYFIDPDREMLEYIHFLYGILDDTDLLSKVSYKDVEITALLLNRMHTLAGQKESEIIDLSDLKKDEHYAQNAAKRILQNEEMYSLYKKVYQYREEEVEKNLQLAAEGKSFTLFSDTKEQNDLARVGQTKMFSNNIQAFEKHKAKIQKMWVENAQKVHRENSDLDLHLHMISTIVGAEDVFKGGEVKYKHKDELWFWIPDQGLAIEHLKSFLNTFQSLEQMQHNDLSVEFLGDNAADLEQIFKESFLKVEMKKQDLDLPIAVLYYNAGSVNSRKALITPCLPTITN